MMIFPDSPPTARLQRGRVMSVRFWAATATLAALACPVLMWAPAVAQEPKPAPKPDAKAGADVVGSDKVWQFHLTLTAKDYDAMQPPGGGFGFGPGFGKGPNPPNPPKPGDPKRDSDISAFGTEFPWVHTSLAADGKTIDNVGLRYKG